MAYLDFGAIRLAVPIRQVCAALAVSLRPDGHRGELRGACPIHRSRNPKSRSFAVDDRNDRWYCHSCRLGGDVIDLWHQTGHGEDLWEAAFDLASLFLGSVPLVPRGGTEKRNGEEAARQARRRALSSGPAWSAGVPDKTGVEEAVKEE